MTDHSKRIIDHGEIKAWAKENGGKPAIVSETEDTANGPGVLRFSFGRDDEGLKTIDWPEFFEIFDKQNLALIVDTSGDNANFNRFTSRVD